MLQVLLPCAAALVVALFSLALILFWSQQEEVLGTNEVGATVTIAGPSTSATGTSQAPGRGGRRGLLASLGLGILETLSGTPWNGEGGASEGGTSEQDCSVLSSTKVGSVQARTRGAAVGRGKEELGP
ncbi:hypothetical protein DUNSADRAFT_17880 [Dunaliella salina]|uniref:Encoded protein n=1 Tax=Dunaliella salina TaxID=3046 RepID=A0ABZ3KGG2_DUNSA|nr:hypothetical protein DUNSADRAFT_17880 [Dunaliella salina]|eukprot:KAF5828260.1 hypothetical protein DUNSADRAFT_17880 [Dunaliella salina]